MTDGKISSLSPDTKRLVRELKPDHPIYIDAFISGDVPEQYIKTRLNLISMLKEFQAMAGDKIRVNIHNNLEPFSEEAALAEEQFGIRPEQIRSVRAGRSPTKRSSWAPRSAAACRKSSCPSSTMAFPWSTS